MGNTPPVVIAKGSMVRLYVSVIVVDVVKSVSVTRKNVAPATVGVPLTSPVAGSTDKPAGIDRPVHDKLAPATNGIS